MPLFKGNSKSEGDAYYKFKSALDDYLLLRSHYSL